MRSVEYIVVENVVENTPRRIVVDVWSDSIIHNAYEYLMGNKQPKEKPQRKRKGFATFICANNL